MIYILGLPGQLPESGMAFLLCLEALSADELTPALETLLLYGGAIDRGKRGRLLLGRRF